MGMIAQNSGRPWARSAESLARARRLTKVGVKKSVVRKRAPAVETPFRTCVSSSAIRFCRPEIHRVIHRNGSHPPCSTHRVIHKDDCPFSSRCEPAPIRGSAWAIPGGPVRTIVCRHRRPGRVADWVLRVAWLVLRVAWSPGEAHHPAMLGIPTHAPIAPTIGSTRVLRVARLEAGRSA